MAGAIEALYIYDEHKYAKITHPLISQLTCSPAALSSPIPTPPDL
jgi:hypothetical protein